MKTFILTTGLAAAADIIPCDDCTVTCPEINCDTTIGNFNCFDHSQSTPVESINTYLCPYDQVCNLEIDKFAWVTSMHQRV